MGAVSRLCNCTGLMKGHITIYTAGRFIQRGLRSNSPARRPSTSLTNQLLQMTGILFR